MAGYASDVVDALFRINGNHGTRIAYRNHQRSVELLWDTQDGQHRHETFSTAKGALSS
jgi:hypothetical protein